MNDIELASVAAIKAILYPDGFHFSKSMGQNFLVNPAIPDRIASTLCDDGSWGVLEVGPGLGALTDRLSLRAARLVAIELDDRLIPHLETAFGDRAVTIVKGDVLKADLPSLVKAHLDGLHPACYANLPYYITSPAISALLEARCFERIVLMVQKEVAQRICAAPGTPAYSAFTVYVSYFAGRKTLFGVPAGCFFPAPKVDSAVIELTPFSHPPVKVRDEALFFRTVRASFENRRKTLSNSIASAAGGREAAVTALQSAGIDSKRRGETLSLEEFAALADAIAAL